MTIQVRLRFAAFALAAGLTSAAPAPLLAAPDAKDSAAAPKSASSLPGGASSLQETYDDWVVACVQQGAVKKCSQAQVQTDQQSRQRVLSIEIAPQGDKAEGLMILPFGLVLEKGASVQVDDDTAAVQVLKFRTCLPLGWVVPVVFDAAMLAKLKTGKALKVKAEPEMGGKEVELAVSLKGFGNALDRTIALMK